MSLSLPAPVIWLRDNCPCPQCRHPGSGQKLVSIGDLPADLRIDEMYQAGGEVHIRFGPDGHVAVFNAGWLGSWWSPTAGLPPDDRTEDAKRTWTAAEAGPRLAVSWADYQEDPLMRAQALETVLRAGFVVLREVEPREREVLSVAASFGFVRRTNYGELFDVRIEADPVSLAFTALPIAPHTDNPYRDPVPTLQLLHCLASTARGGESGLVDGFRAAAILRQENPYAFGILTATEVTFRFAAADADLRATRPMIGLDSYGRIREIRCNNRSLQPVRLSAAATERFYAAYRAFAQVIGRPGMRHVVRLRRGDCVVFDNTRVLHARAAFDGPPGARHLQGCYADMDGLASTLAVLRRRTG